MKATTSIERTKKGTRKASGRKATKKELGKEDKKSSENGGKERDDGIYL